MTEPIETGAAAARAQLLWWARACAALKQLEHEGHELLQELRPFAATGLVDALNLNDAVVTLSDTGGALAGYCPRPPLALAEPQPEGARP